ncbi:hypothetical protein HK097_007968 [Rhizophlyctis rosea]|uniref:Uncharacterized protein n=1 Tax=Rhizophlyctis rosea TaxID=64517 RepID=A0AAD5X8J5_9FUNG|nr:hypothetical protein HK097_007968 [Rhizophlyctis rosea]
MCGFRTSELNSEVADLELRIEADSCHVRGKEVGRGSARNAVASRAATTGKSRPHNAHDAFRIARFHRFELLEAVFQQFLETNIRRGRHYGLDDLLTLGTQKTHFSYTHDGIPYKATVFMYEGPHRDCLNIKLKNDRFEYIQKSGGSVFPRHNSDDWVWLEKSRCWDHMTFM